MLRAFRLIFEIALFCAIGLGAGAYSVQWLLAQDLALGIVQAGQWQAFPQRGSADADPYTKAKLARSAVLPLGQAEGIRFSASADAQGRPLRTDCNYNVTGAFPTARLWTLDVIGSQGGSLKHAKAPQPNFHSQAMIFEPDGGIDITIGPLPVPGNWLATDPALDRDSGPVEFVVRFYDTPLTSSTGGSQFAMPDIVRGECLS